MPCGMRCMPWMQYMPRQDCAPHPFKDALDVEQETDTLQTRAAWDVAEDQESIP